jgi:hypothetical protein
VARRYTRAALEAGRFPGLVDTMIAFDEDTARVAVLEEVVRLSRNGKVPKSQSPESLGIGISGFGRNAPIEVCEEDEPAAREFIIAGLIPEDAPTIIYGAGGIAKSFLALGLASAVAAGGEFLGTVVACGRALYIDAELDETEFLRRAYRIARGMGLTRPPAGLYYWRLPGSLGDDAVWELMAGYIAQIRPRVIVLDSLSVACFGKDLASAEVMTLVMKRLQTLGTVVAIDHTRSTEPGANLSEYSPFGSVFKRNLARSVIQVIQADGGGLLLRQKKSNFDAIAKPVGVRVGFDRDAVKISTVGMGDEALVGIEDHMGAHDRLERVLAQRGPSEPKGLAEELEVSVKTVKNGLTALRKQGRAKRTGNGKWQSPEVPIPTGPGLGTPPEIPLWEEQ